MNSLDLEKKVSEIDPSNFQRLCDEILQKEENVVVSYGNCEGVGKVRKGTPDSYIINIIDNTLTFVEYTTQSSDLFRKISSDIKKCVEESKTFKTHKLKKILYFINNNKLSAPSYDKIKHECNLLGIDIKIYFLNEICKLLKKHKSIIREFFNETFIDDNISSLEEFIKFTRRFKGVDHTLSYCERPEDEKSILNSLEKNFITIVYGNPGVGKSMLVVQTLRGTGKEVFCVHKVNEDSLDTINSCLNDNKDFIIFIDDVNEVSSFERFLNSFDLDKSICFKIVCTVREYALSKVIEILKQFDFEVSSIKIKPLEDESIKTIISKNLNIINNKQLDKICIISKGNPRLAYMAGKVVKDKGAEYLIDRETIFKEYFSTYIGDSLSEVINEYYDILGIIAFLNRIDIQDKASFSDLLDLCNIEKERFINSIPKLNSVEIIDVFEERVIQINDSNLSDYILEKSFIENKICSLSDLITIFLSTKKDQIINTINILLNVYSCEKNREYIKEEVWKCWEFFENQNKLDEFIKVFYSFNPNRALVYCNKKLKSQFQLIDDNPAFEKQNGSNDFINIIRDLAYDGISEAFDSLCILLSYGTIRNYSFEALKELTILTPDKISYYGVNNMLIFNIEKYKKMSWFNEAAIELICESLKFEFSYSSFAKNASISYTSFSIRDDYPGIIEYRNKLWDICYLLDDSHKYLLINKFLNIFPQTYSAKIYKNDIDKINLLIKSIKNVDNVMEKMLKIKAIDKLSYIKLDESYFLIHYETELSLLKTILNANGEKSFYEENKIQLFVNNSSIDEIKNSIILCNIVISKDKNYVGKVDKYLKLLLESLNDRQKNFLLDINFLESLSCIIKIPIIKANFLSKNRKKTLNLLKENLSSHDFFECCFIVFDYIEKSEIDEDISALFEKCFKKDLLDTSDNIVNRRTDVLFKFSKNYNDFIEKIKEVYNSKEIIPQKACNWFDLLFNEYAFNPNEIVINFNKGDELKLLENIVFFIASKRKYDTLCKYVYLISNFDKGFLKTVVKELLDCNSNIYSNYDLLKNLWYFDDSLSYADIIFDGYVNSDLKLYNIFFLEDVFIPTYDFDKFIEWANKKLLKISTDEEYILLMDLVSKCSDVRCVDIYINSIKNEIKIELFQKILLICPSTISFHGSEIDLLNHKIEMVHKILNGIPYGVEYLEYKACLENYEKVLLDECKQAKIREKIEFSDRF